MRLAKLCALNGIILLAGCYNATAQEWVPLIKNNSLDGWTKKGGEATFTIENGEIVGRSGDKKKNTFLCTDKEYSEFELELEFKVDPNLNSGVQIRSESKPDFKDGQVHGYQVEIDPSPRAWTGGIYDEGRRGKYLMDLSKNEPARKAFKQGEWNTIWVSARGNTIKTRLNGVDAVEVQDDLTPRGFIGLQVHATTSTIPLEVRFRNIRLIDWSRVKDTVWENDGFSGDYEGKTQDGKPLVAQVWNKGDGVFHARVLSDFESKKVLAEADGKLKDGKVQFEGSNGKGTISGDTASITLSNGAEIELRKVVRKSPTLGAAPPEGAKVLLDGKSLDGWQRVDGKPATWKLTGDGAMQVVTQGAHTNHETKDAFTDMELHLEFRTPLMPFARGQQRGNSGVYIQGSYEIQVLDSYALEGLDNECGGIYKVGAPRVNMAFPPLDWQTYDISFKAARWDGDRKVENARITVKHNGVLIQDNVELPDATGGAKYKGEPKHPAPLVLQDHGDAVQYRNIWVK